MKKYLNDGDLRTHKFIVFCGDHYNPLGVVRSLGEKKLHPIVILVAKRPHIVNLSRYAKKIHRVDDIESGLNILLQIYGDEKRKPFIYTCSDEIAALLDQNYGRLIDKFFFFHGGRQGIITQYLNKKLISELAVEKGCKTLKYEVVRKGELPTALNYPVITKAINSTLLDWKNEMHICYSEDELLQAYEKMRSETILVQEYIRKKNEFCVDGFSYNAGEEVEIPYFTNYLRFSDISYGGYMILRPLERNKIYYQIKSILKEVGYTGIFEAEFLIDHDNSLYFLEINFRNSTWSYAYTYGGYNMPYLWAKATLDGRLDLREITPKRQIIAMSEQEDFAMSVRTKRISAWKWVKSFVSADCHYLFNWRDPLPFLYYLVGFIKNFVKRKIFNVPLTTSDNI